MLLLLLVFFVGGYDHVLADLHLDLFVATLVNERVIGHTVKPLLLARHDVPAHPAPLTHNKPWYQKVPRLILREKLGKRDSHHTTLFCS
jgi:hypothetical protein